MTTPAMKTELLHHLNRLPAAMQCQVLQFARSLEMTVRAGVPGSILASFAGSIRLDLQCQEKNPVMLTAVKIEM